MPIEFKMKLVMIGHSLRVTVPKEIAEALGLKEGDTLGLSLTDSEIRVRKIKV
ncbi:MAG: AbrB/MazE/SpoVT family DNA-binding domain-containing protein [Candidatus Bathyarchaeia archaeon]|jgi:AbrB family looped-hinge helix DNA binding protein